MNTYDDLFDERMEMLLRHKHFTELSSDERALALKHTGGEAEYTQLRTALLASEQALHTPIEGLIPDPALHARLRTALQNTQKAPARTPSLWIFLSRALSYKIPAYQAGLAMMVLTGAFLFFHDRDNVPHVSQTLAGVIDTIKTEIRSDNVIGGYRDNTLHPSPSRSVRHAFSHRDTKEHQEDSVAEMSPGIQAFPIRNEGRVFVGRGNFPMLESQKRGRSMSEDTALARFRVSSNGSAF